MNLCKWGFHSYEKFSGDGNKEYIIDTTDAEESELNIELERIYNLFEEANLWVEIDGVIYLENFMTNEKISIIIAKAIDNGLLESNVIEIMPVIDAVFYGDNADELKGIVDSLPKETYDTEEMRSTLIAIATFYYSYEYWEEYSGQSRIDGNGGILVADLVGGLIGSAGSPFGSLIGAFVYSYVFNDVFLAEH